MTLSALALFTATYTCSWLFPGGTPSSASSCTPPEVVYTTPGPKRVTLTICTRTCTSTTKTMQVYDPRPRISRIAASPTPSYTDEPLRLTVAASGKPPLAFLWKTRDGRTFSGNPVILPPGALSTSQAITLTVSNSSGSVVRSFAPSLIPPQPSVKSLSISPSFLFPGASATLRAVVTGRPPLAYRWELPDGSTRTTELPVLTLTLPALPPTSHKIRLVASNSSGSSSRSLSFLLRTPPLFVAFDPVCNGPCIFPPSTPVSFRIQTTTPPGTAIELDWNADGRFEETVTDTAFVHRFDQPGFYRPRARLRFGGRSEVRSASRPLTITAHR